MDKQTQTNKYIFYVGWNNQTHKREFAKAIKCLNSLNVKGFSLNKSILGYWANQKENSFKIEIINTFENPFNDSNAKTLKLLLEKDLNQFLVIVEKTTINLIE